VFAEYNPARAASHNPAMVYTIKISAAQAAKVRHDEVTRVQSLLMFVFVAHRVLEDLHRAGYNTADFMGYTSEGTTVDFSRIPWSYEDYVRLNPPPPAEEKDSGWG
jgi:hypothetical protein